VIEIEGFIDSSEVHPTLYESPYFAGPDGPVAAKTYSLLTEALKASGKVGVGKVVLRDREEVVMIAPLDGGDRAPVASRVAGRSLDTRDRAPAERRDPH